MKNKNIIIIVVASVVALALLIGGIIWGISLFGGDGEDKGKDKGKDKESTSQTDGDKTVNGGEIEADDVKGSAGSTVKVEIKLNKNPGINTCYLEFEYDETVMSLVGHENGDILDKCEGYGNGFLIEDSGIKNITKNGTLITLEFAVKNDAAKGSYPIKLAADSMIVDADEATVIADISLGSVIVE